MLNPQKMEWRDDKILCHFCHLADLLLQEPGYVVIPIPYREWSNWGVHKILVAEERSLTGSL